MQKGILTLKGILKTDKKKPTGPSVHPKASLEEAKNWLCTQFPQAFDFESPTPLKIGIHKDLWSSYLALSPKVSRRKVRQAMTAYIFSQKYAQAILNENYRYDLQGEEAGEVEDMHKETARKKLSRFQKSLPQQDKTI